MLCVTNLVYGLKIQPKNNHSCLHLPEIEREKTVMSNL